MMRKFCLSLPLLGAALALHGVDLPTAAKLRSGSNPAETGLKVADNGKYISFGDTSGGSRGNASSEFTLSYPADSALVKQMNAVLARPEGGAAVDFEIAFSLLALERSDQLAHSNFKVRLDGRQWVLPHDIDFKEMSFLPGKRVKLDSANVPGLRFRLECAGGKRQVGKVELIFSIRVDTGGKPETYSLGDFSFRELPAPVCRAEFLNYAPSAAQTAALEKLENILFIAGPFSKGSDNAKRYIDAVKAGKTVFVDLRFGEDLPKEMAELLPVNAWPVKQPGYRRTGTPLAGGTLYHGGPYDLHIPGSPMENSMMRYLWEEYEKPLDNTDWRIHLATANGMPVLVSGRVGAAKVFVFGGNSEDRDFVTSPGYPAFWEKLAGEMAPEPGKYADVSKLEIKAERYQPEELCVNVTNRSDRRAEALVAFQVSNWEREILNKAAVPVVLGPGETKSVALPRRGAWKGEAAIAESGSGIPYLRLRACLLSPDRKASSKEYSTVVFTGRELDITVTEDFNSWPDRENMTQTDGEFDGTHAMLYVRPVGSQPEITVEVGNRFAPMGPLAVAADEDEKDNLTIEGLNDLSLSRADARHKGKWAGGWSGTKGGDRRLTLTWEKPVTLSAFTVEGFGGYRNENFLNPRAFSLKGDGKPIFDAKRPEFKEAGSASYARCGGSFAATPVKELTMEMAQVQTGRRANLFQSNSVAAIRELSLFGWPEEGGCEVTGTLEITAVDPATGKSENVLSKKLTVKPNSREAVKVKLPARDTFGTLQYRIEFNSVRENRDVLYLELGRKPIFDKIQLSRYQPGLFCTRGWYDYDSFGRGMRGHVQGWGGPHDQIWALSHGIMETGYTAVAAPERMFTVNARNSHYSNPWRYLPDGTYGWDLSVDIILEESLRRYPDDKGVYVGASDRWNGIPVNATFGWDMYVRFDQYLKKTSGKGLRNRSARAIAEEIVLYHADAWQKWHMEQYAEKIEATAERYAAKGRAFHFETHGSFPLAGGELGDRLGKYHLGVGTDLFWELRNQDLFGSLGSRFGVVAANPNLRSGLYKQWGWVNSESNRFWFANNGSTEPARRQWYATYYMGRVDSEGVYAPYHVMGYSLQGGISTKFYPHEIGNYARTFQFGTKVRPEQPAGFGLAVSWDAHLGRMSSDSRTFGFGLYAGGRQENQIDHRMGRLFERLVKHGVPVGFVTSSHALKNWNGRNPLILADASDWSREELATVERLAKGGAPVIAFAGDAPAPEFFLKNAEAATAGEIKLLKRGNIIYCPLNAREIPAESLNALVGRIMEHAGIILESSTNMPVTPFVNSGALFLAFGGIADFNRIETVKVRPESLLPGLKNPVFIDLDRNVKLEARKEAGGSWSFQLPAAACDGRMVMIVQN